MILDYNKYMGGVDNSDKMVFHNAAVRSTQRCWEKKFTNLVNNSLLNT